MKGSFLELYLLKKALSWYAPAPLTLVYNSLCLCIDGSLNRKYTIFICFGRKEENTAILNKQKQQNQSEQAEEIQIFMRTRYTNMNEV